LYIIFGTVSKQYNRRQILKTMSAASAVFLLPSHLEADTTRVSGKDFEIQIATVSAHTVRLTIAPLAHGQAAATPLNGSLVKASWGPPLRKLRGEVAEQTVASGNLKIKISPDPVTFTITDHQDQPIQTLKWDQETGALLFTIGDTPLLGMGEGGPQFDRRGSTDPMRSGQRGFQLATHGGRVPIPWLIGTSGWAIYFHQPFGTFDFTGTEGKFLPVSADSALPLDVFIVASHEPETLMAEYARLTGYAEMPPLWSFGYQQSHRTLGGREEVLSEAKTFREKKLPCDALIYLGTGFCPAGWNADNGSFLWNPRIFPDPKEILDELRKDNFRTVLHVVIMGDQLRGTVHDPCALERFDEASASCYWDEHRKVFALGVGGWWPDEGDPLGIESRLVRNRMYWEGPQIDRPNERPYALHRNGYAGMQRYGSFLWSGDVDSSWATLAAHIPNAINTALTGIPYWGTDIGGFVPTKELTGELYVRWFQFGAFCPLFRCHGRTWKLRLPFGWDTGDPGPVEIRGYSQGGGPDVSELHNAQVEPICRKYLELRYRMLPYLYSAVRECSSTGMPIVRALWLHYPDDPVAVSRGDEYLWGRDVLVAPVVEKGATSRKVYLPQGAWYDFWTGEKMEGGREISREVDLETVPLYVRAGSILPLGPVKQHTGEKVDEPLSITVYPGADASFQLYEDDGISFDYRKGQWMGTEMVWNDTSRKLKLSLTAGSRVLPPLRRKIEVKLASAVKNIEFEGHPLEVSLS
jgi:alpha-glucosidase (family GH31 glycosyl hydrolase)